MGIFQFDKHAKLCEKRLAVNHRAGSAPVSADSHSPQDLKALDGLASCFSRGGRR